MNEHAIRVIEIGKEYMIGERVQYYTLRENIAGFTSKVISGIRKGRFGGHDSTDARPGINFQNKQRPHGIGSHSKPNYFWSLKDVSFDVKRGEILGIIGSNGAGKSTLLKLISGITEPTEGRIEIHGRIGSLLEVGTGFHQELTGRENIFLNGAILGMKKREIERKFDEIVDFSGIEQFVDTPVKFYSSGMRVRLGFSVAAHLDPDILLLDEVLAVGDARFQQKCLGKLNEVASSEGRTIIFVSHDMAAILSLCERVILMADGKVSTIGTTEQVVDHYLKTASSVEEIPLENRTDIDSSSDRSVIATYLRIENVETGKPIRPSSRIVVKVGYRSKEPVRNLIVQVKIRDSKTGQVITTLDSENSSNIPERLPAEGTIVCTTENTYITPGRCKIDLQLYHLMQRAYKLENAGFFNVEAENVHGKSANSRYYGMFSLEQDWSLENSQ